MRRAILLSGGALVLSSSIVAQHVDSNLRVLFNPRDYVQPVHGERTGPDADYFFATSEDVRLYIRVANQTDQTLSLVTNGVTPEAAIGVQLVRREGTIRSPIKGGRIVIDGPPTVTGNAQSFSDQWSERIVLPPRRSVAIPVVIRSDAPLAPGIYELQMSGAAVSCEPDCSVRNQAGLFRFEIRSAEGLPAQLDRLFRRTFVAIDYGEFDAADRTIAEMLTLHPSSSAAYQLRAEKAERLGDWTLATVAYEQALRLLGSGQDRSRRKEDAEVGYLKSKAAHARSRMK